MASRAHVMHDYGLGRASERPRREVWYRSSEDPIEIPRGGSSSGSLAVVISAVIASSVILGGAYAIYIGPPAPMARTAVQPLTTTWQLDAEPHRAAVVKALRGPAQALPILEPTMMTTEEQESASAAPGGSFTPSNPPAATSSPEVIIDDRYQLPQAAPAPAPQPAVYPDPVKTPAEAIGPELDLDKPSPSVDPENPY